MNARHRSSGIGITIVRFLGGAVVAMAAAVVAFTVFSGLTEIPERTPFATSTDVAGRPASPGATVPGTLEQPVASAPATAPGVPGGVAAPRPSSGGTAPGASLPEIAGTESSGLGGNLGASGAQPAPSAPLSLAPAQPSALGAPGAPGADAGAQSELAPPADVDDARNQLAILLGDAPVAPQGEAAPSADGAALAPAAPAPGAETAALPAEAPASPEPAPSVPVEAPAVAEPAEAAEPADPPAPELALAGPALEVNARDVDLPAGVPAIAFVVSDAAEPGGLTPEMLAGLPFPITLGIVPGDDTAAALAEAAREAGHEVVVQLPTDTLGGRVAESDALLTDLDADAASRRALAALAALPQGVAVSAYPSSAGQAASDAVMALLAQHGFAYLENRAVAGGVAELGARRAGVPFAAADRSVSRRSTPSQLAQQVEAATADAAKGTPQIVLVPATAEALRALVAWSLQRGGQVRPVPLSAVLRARSG